MDNKLPVWSTGLIPTRQTRSLGTDENSDHPVLQRICETGTLLAHLCLS